MRPYKGYTATVHFSEDDMVFHGHIVGINDICTFEATTAEGLIQSFRDCVDDYLVFCADHDKPADKPFSGNFSLRMTPELHGRVVRVAGKNSKSVNQWITDTLSEEASREMHSPHQVVTVNRPSG